MQLMLQLCLLRLSQVGRSDLLETLLRKSIAWRNVMTAFANIKPSSILYGATEAEYDANANVCRMSTLDAAVSIDISSAGSPGQLAPTGYIPGTPIARWEDRSCGITVGFPVFTMSVRKPTKDSNVTRVALKYVSPTLAQTSPSTSTGYQPAPAKAYEITANVEFIIPQQCTRLERIKFLSRLVSLFAGEISASDGSPLTATVSPIKSAVVDGEVPF